MEHVCEVEMVLSLSSSLVHADSCNVLVSCLFEKMLCHILGTVN